MKILTAAQTRAAEERSVALGMDWLRLMENAGAACANVIRKNCDVQGKNVCVVCGRGGNGGDGFVIARKLFSEGARVSVILSSGRPTHASALENYRRAVEVGVPIYDYAQETVRCLDLIRYSELIVDAVFGFGFHGAPSGSEAAVIGYINASRAAVVSVDLPSGASCDSGRVEGGCVHADLTVTFTTMKPCHVTFPAAEFCGRTVCASIGMPDEVVEGIPSDLRVVERADIAPVFAPRRRNSHKGNYGKPLLFCGSYGMAGAAMLCGRAALRCGSGIVHMAVPESIYPILAANVPEAVFLPLKDSGSDALEKLNTALKTADALLIGPGLGRGAAVSEICRELIGTAKCPIILDADGINALDGRIDIIEKANADIVLTPHPGEMARLLGITIAEIERDRTGIASALSCRTGAVVVLKGAYTVIAEPSGAVWINLTGSAGMATGGSGDVLAGMIAAFLGRGFSPALAAKAGVYLHGAAGELAAEKLSETSMLPSDLVECLPTLFKSR